MSRKQYSQYFNGFTANRMRAKRGRMSRGQAAYHEKGSAIMFITGRDTRVKKILANS